MKAHVKIVEKCLKEIEVDVPKDFIKRLSLELSDYLETEYIDDYWIDVADINEWYKSDSNCFEDWIKQNIDEDAVFEEFHVNVCANVADAIEICFYTWPEIARQIDENQFANKLIEYVPFKRVFQYDREIKDSYPNIKCFVNLDMSIDDFLKSQGYKKTDLKKARDISASEAAQSRSFLETLKYAMKHEQNLSPVFLLSMTINDIEHLKEGGEIYIHTAACCLADHQNNCTACLVQIEEPVTFSKKQIKELQIEYEGCACNYQNKFSPWIGGCSITEESLERAKLWGRSRIQQKTRFPLPKPF